MQTTAQLRTIGTITAPHGLKGEVVMRATDQDAPWMNLVNTVFLFFKDGPREAQVESIRFQNDHLVVKFDLIPNRDVAETLKNIPVKALESDLPPLEANEFYMDDLMHLSVYSADSGKHLGKVVEVLSADAGEFLEVESPGIPENVLVPFLEVFVEDVDLDKRRVTVTGLDSLFEAGDETDEEAPDA